MVPHGRLSPISCDSAMPVSVQPQLGLARKLNLQSPAVCALNTGSVALNRPLGSSHEVNSGREGVDMGRGCCRVF